MKTDLFFTIGIILVLSIIFHCYHIRVLFSKIIIVIPTRNTCVKNLNRKNADSTCVRCQSFLYSRNAFVQSLIVPLSTFQISIFDFEFISRSGLIYCLRFLKYATIDVLQSASVIQQINYHMKFMLIVQIKVFFSFTCQWFLHLLFPRRW